MKVIATFYEGYKYVLQTLFICPRKVFFINYIAIISSFTMKWYNLRPDNP